MKKNNNITRIIKYLLPASMAIMLVLVFVFGLAYFRSSLMKQTISERSSQLEDMVIQIRANLVGGLEVNGNLTEGLNRAVSGKHFYNEAQLYDTIKSLEEQFCLDLYDSRLMLLDEQGTAYLSDGNAGIWNDVDHLLEGGDEHTFVSETDNIDGCFLVFSKKLSSAITIEDTGAKFTYVIILKDIKSMKQYYTTEIYGGSAATYIIKNNGTLAYYDGDSDDVISVRNVYKALGEATYVGDKTFDNVKTDLKKKGISVANILLKDTEYYYCLTSLKDYDMTLMLLLPANKVAKSTLNMMNATIRTQAIFMVILVVMLLFVGIGFVSAQKSKELVKVEQEANSKLEQLRIEAESANAAKSTFLNNMSHDIRTPMNAIIGFTNIALKNNPAEEIKRCLNKILDSSEHLLLLINDVLDISRIESGKIKFAPSPVNIEEVTESVLTIMYGYLTNRDLNFVTDFEELRTKYVLTDALRVKEILVNILGNAVKFTEDGGTIRFKVSYHKGIDDNHIIVRYAVSDTGIGMSDEFIEHIFDEFSQENNGARTQYKGTGLGMAITKKYVDLMGGTINVESKKGKGSTFVLDLPMVVTDAKSVKKKDYAIGKVNLEGVNVLLAEDNELNAEIAIIQLEEIGLKITRARDGKEAVEIFENNPKGTFDVILMDVMMPNLNGYEATEAIRNNNEREDGRTIPIIAMTANAFAEDVQASIDAGMNGHLSKPIVIDEVVKTIARNIETTV